MFCFYRVVVGGNNTTKNPPGNGQPTDININFKLFPDDYFTGYDVYAALVGSNNKGQSYTGSITEKTLAVTTFLGESAIPVESKTEFTITNGGFGSATLKNYYSVNADDRRFLGVGGNIVTVSATTTPIPETARIGDSGMIGTYIDNANFETTLSWRLEDGFNGNAKLVLLNVTDKPSGDLDNRFTTTYLIQPDGSRLSVKLVTYNDNVNIEVTLEGDY